MITGASSTEEDWSFSFLRLLTDFNDFLNQLEMNGHKMAHVLKSKMMTEISRVGSNDEIGLCELVVVEQELLSDKNPLVGVLASAGYCYEYFVRAGAVGHGARLACVVDACLNDYKETLLVKSKKSIYGLQSKDTVDTVIKRIIAETQLTESHACACAVGYNVWQSRISKDVRNDEVRKRLLDQLIDFLLDPSSTSLGSSSDPSSVSTTSQSATPSATNSEGDEGSTARDGAFVYYGSESQPGDGEPVELNPGVTTLAHLSVFASLTQQNRLNEARTTPSPVNSVSPKSLGSSSPFGC